MSTTTLEFQFKVGGQLASASAVLLSSADGTYGIKRTDTGQVLISDATPMTEVQAGVYRYVLTVDPGVPLSWWAEPTYNGVAYHFERQTLTAVSAPAGYYGQLSDVQAVAGISNLASYSNMEGGTDLDPARVQIAMNNADSEINMMLRQQGVACPAPSTDLSFSALAQAFGYIVTSWLYRSRGQRDTLPDGSIDYAKENGWRKEAKVQIRKYISAQRQTLTGQIQIESP